MSIHSVHLRKLLELFFLPDNKLTTKLKADVRSAIAKKQGIETAGGDFYSPFWTDAKNHVSGESDLDDQTAIRIGSNYRRKRLYPVLKEKFLEWWNQKRRWSNQPYELFEKNPKSRFEFNELGGTVKVENTLAAKMGDGTNRIVYPYFSENPALTEPAVRLGLWMMQAAFPQHKLDDMRILDVQRAVSYSATDVPLNGDEKDMFKNYYMKILKKWDRLHDDFPW